MDLPLCKAKKHIELKYWNNLATANFTFLYLINIHILGAMWYGDGLSLIYYHCIIMWVVLHAGWYPGCADDIFLLHVTVLYLSTFETLHMIGSLLGRTVFMRNFLFLVLQHWGRLTLKRVRFALPGGLIKNPEGHSECWPLFLFHLNGFWPCTEDSYFWEECSFFLTLSFIHCHVCRLLGKENKGKIFGSSLQHTTQKHVQLCGTCSARLRELCI